MTDALLELAHREYTHGDYKNAEAHCKQVLRFLTKSRAFQTVRDLGLDLT